MDPDHALDDPDGGALPLVPTGSGPLAESSGGGVTLKRLLADFFRSRSPETVRAYRADLRHFQRYLAAPSLDDAVQVLIGGGKGNSKAILLEYRAELQAGEYAPATINRRLSSVHALLELAEDLGLIDWTARVKSLRVVALRDTRGPGHGGYLAMLEVARKRVGPIGARDHAILRLLFDLALRRGEVVRLDLADVDLDGRRLWVRGKWRTEKEALTLPEPTAEALEAWIAVRGDGPGALFVNFDPARKGSGRLTGQSVWRTIKRLGELAGLSKPVWCHALRHASVTRALDVTGGDVRSVQRFSRHRSPDMVIRYDDARQDLGGEVARLVAESDRDRDGEADEPR